MQRLIKDPNSNEWFTVPWANRLGAAKIAATLYQVPAGLTLASQDFDPDAATASVRLSGGTLGTTYTVTSRITTDDGQTLDFSFKILIREE